jgi:hypothetical protein
LKPVEPQSVPRPFTCLFRLFLTRTFHGGDESGAEEVDLSLGLVLSLLALPGGLYSLLLFEKYSTLLLWMRGQNNFDPVAATMPDEYFFIVLSMVVTGSVAVWRWDSIFPDRRDYMNLVPLPISIRLIFLANLTAVLCLAAVLALVVNAASSLLFPLAASSGQGTFRYAGELVVAHIAAVVLASVFSFSAIFASVGILMAALPYRLFRRLSIYVRGLIMALLVGLLSTSFAIPPMISRLPITRVRFLPSVWFLGLSQLIHGSANPILAWLGWLALKTLPLVIVVAVVAYTVSYRRYFARIPEEAEVSRQAGGTTATFWILPVLDRWLLQTPFQQAGYRFVLKILLRSERHNLVFAGFAGLALTLASQVLFAAFGASADKTGDFTTAEVLSIPLIFSYFILVGLRFAFDVPADPQANWIFKLLVAKETNESAPLARKVMLTFVLPWVVVFVFPTYGYLLGWAFAAFHTGVVILFSLVLAHILLFGYRKLPFTCSYPPFRHLAVVIVLFSIFGYFAFVVFLSNLEHRALVNPLYVIPLLLIAAVAWYGVTGLGGTIADVDKQLIFEESAPATFELLDLEQRS